MQSQYFYDFFFFVALSTCQMILTEPRLHQQKLNKKKKWNETRQQDTKYKHPTHKQIHAHTILLLLLLQHIDLSMFIIIYVAIPFQLEPTLWLHVNLKWYLNNNQEKKK